MYLGYSCTNEMFLTYFVTMVPNIFCYNSFNGTHFIYHGVSFCDFIGTNCNECILYHWWTTYTNVIHFLCLLITQTLNETWIQNFILDYFELVYKYIYEKNFNLSWLYLNKFLLFHFKTFSASMSILVITYSHNTFYWQYTKHSKIVFHTHNTSKSQFTKYFSWFFQQ